MTSMATSHATAHASTQLSGVRLPLKTMLATFAIALVATAMTLPLSASDHPTAPATTTTNFAVSTATAPRLETNRGQWGPSIRYFARAANYTVAFGARGALLNANDSSDHSTVSIYFRGSNPAPTRETLDHLATGTTQSQNDDTGRIVYRNVYPGIDVAFYMTPQAQLAYDFIATPDADLSQIALEYRGADDVRIGDDGALNVQWSDNRIAQQPARIFLDSNDRLLAQHAYFVDHGDNTIGFALLN